MNGLIDFCIGSKETKRAFDYRCCLVIISNQIRHKINSNAQLLLDTLVEIQEIAYCSESERTPRSVLRFHNLTWYHAMLCRMVMGFKLKKLTVRKLYGTYFHNITSHAPIQNRIINGRSANTEEQERVFNALTNITRTTSSFHGNHIIANILIRLQAEKHLSANYHASTVETQQSHVSKLASSLPKFNDTIIPKNIMINHPASWQAHLERSSDFLRVGRGVWWDTNENGDTHFFDSKGSPESLEAGPVLHHFRSSSFKSEESYLKECWLKCLEQKCDLPIYRLQTENEEGDMVTIPHTSSASCSISSSAELVGDKFPCDGRVIDRLAIDLVVNDNGPDLAMSRDSDVVLGDDMLGGDVASGGDVVLGSVPVVLRGDVVSGGDVVLGGDFVLDGDVDGSEKDGCGKLGNCDVPFNDDVSSENVIANVWREDVTMGKSECRPTSEETKSQETAADRNKGKCNV